MDIEKKLEKLFDYQHFEKNERLEKLIKTAGKSGLRELSDENLSMLNAAGDPHANTGGFDENEDGWLPKDGVDADDRDIKAWFGFGNQK